MAIGLKPEEVDFVFIPCSETESEFELEYKSQFEEKAMELEDSFNLNWKALNISKDLILEYRINLNLHKFEQEKPEKRIVECILLSSLGLNSDPFKIN